MVHGSLKSICDFFFFPGLNGRLGWGFACNRNWHLCPVTERRLSFPALLDKFVFKMADDRLNVNVEQNVKKKFLVNEILKPAKNYKKLQTVMGHSVVVKHLNGVKSSKFTVSLLLMIPVVVDHSHFWEHSAHRVSCPG